MCLRLFRDYEPNYKKVNEISWHITYRSCQKQPNWIQVILIFHCVPNYLGLAAKCWLLLYSWNLEVGYLWHNECNQYFNCVYCINMRSFIGKMEFRKGVGKNEKLPFLLCSTVWSA